MAVLIAIVVGALFLPVSFLVLALIQTIKEEMDIVIFVLDVIELIVGVLFLVTAFMTPGIVFGTLPTLIILYVITGYVKKERKEWK